MQLVGTPELELRGIHKARRIICLEISMFAVTVIFQGLFLKTGTTPSPNPFLFCQHSPVLDRIGITVKRVVFLCFVSFQGRAYSD